MGERQAVQVSGLHARRLLPVLSAVVLALLGALAAGCFPNLPAVSPDGKYVALCLTPRGEFVAEPTPFAPGRARDLYVAPIDGSGVWRVTSLSTRFGEGDSRVEDLYQAAEPAFSPDGTKLVFVIRHLDGPQKKLATDRGFVVVVDLTNQLGIDLGTNRTWSLGEIAASAAHNGMGDLPDGVPLAIAVDNAHALTPRFSPDSKRLAWIETREWNEQPAVKDELGRRIGSGGFHGQLKVAAIRPGDGLLPMAIPDGFDAVIPEVSWRSDETLIVARRVGLRRGGDPMFSCQAELCELQLETGESRVFWTGALSTYHVGVSAHPAGPVVVDQVWVRHNRSKLLLIDPSGEPGSNATELVTGDADELNVAPRFDFRGETPVLRWFRQTGVSGRQDTDADLVMGSLTFDADGKPVGEVTERAQTIDVAKWGASQITPVSFVRYLATGSSGAMFHAVPRGIYPLEGRPEPLGVSTSDKDNYNGQQLMLSADGSAFAPMMGGLVNRINTWCPDERALIEVARRTLYPRLGNARINDSVMLFDVTIVQKNGQGQPVPKTGQYREMVSGNRIRTEETYGDANVKTWDGRTVRHKTGNNALRDLDPVKNPINQRPFDEFKEQLDERLRLRRLFLLESLEDPAPGELNAAGKFSLRMHSRQASVVLESGSRSLVYVRRFSAFKRGGQAVIEEVYIGFEILGGATVRAWPREVRTKSYWMRDNQQGGAAMQKTTSVIRFVGKFDDWAVSHPSNPRYLVNLPPGIKIYEADASRHSPEFPFDIQNNDPSVDARLVREMPYPFANRGRRSIHSGINQGLPPQCFTSERW